MRSIWTGALTFGLVTIPVKLYVASDQNNIELNMLHKKDLSPVRFARVCRLEEKEIPFTDITKGHQIEKDHYVVLTEDDIKKANVAKSKTIEIIHFTKETNVETIFYDKPYYLEPTKGSEKSYDLLLEALKRCQKVGVAKFVIRTRENIGVIKPYKNTLILNELRYASEIRHPKELNIPNKKMVTEKEIAMAVKFVNQLTETFKPDKYQDSYRKELERIINAKAKGKTIVASGKEPTPTKVNDLMATLKQSLEQQKRSSVSH
jgi:DNA end-binding protein Ku